MRCAILCIAVLLSIGCSKQSTNDSNGSTKDPDSSVADSGGDVSANNSSDADPGDVAAPDVRVDMTPDASEPDLGVPTDCPQAQPAADDRCRTPGLQCEWGSDPREQCRVRGECQLEGMWSITTPRCEPLPDVVCPMTRDDASGTDCRTMDAYCAYDGLVCHCTNCVDGPVVNCQGDPTWMCDAPHPDPTCPPAKPRLGTACREDRAACEYKCGPDGARVCTDGAWASGDGGPCPISTVRVKEQVRYLSSDELAQISRQVQQIPLARYRYVDPALGRGEKLGFIIEDLPAATPAVDRERLMVDLYGYTSMLVADAQARQARLEALEKRLAELEAATLQCAPATAKP